MPYDEAYTSEMSSQACVTNTYILFFYSYDSGYGVRILRT